MVLLQEIDLISFGLRLPHTLVGFVALQPYLHLTAEPFRCEPAHKAAQLSLLERTLAVARMADHGAEKTHFTLMPEYSIPGAEGIAMIESHLTAEAWPTGTIVIGGTDALSRDEYATLCASQDTFVSENNLQDRVKKDEWVNCCVIWVKSPDGRLRRWLQPKIAPAWPEQKIDHKHMFRGAAVYLFKCLFDGGLPCRFLPLVCYDWIGTVENQTIPRQLLAAIHEQAVAANVAIGLSWVFVIERNSSPSHFTFLSAVSAFFQQRAESQGANRDSACVVFANTAGRANPGPTEAYGLTSLIFSRLSPFDFAGCPPTYSSSQSLRESNALAQCGDVLFRERGACIHSFSQYVPGAVNLGAGGRTLPLRRAYVHSVSDDSVDPRSPGLSVPACVKWVNDALDEVPVLSAERATPLVAEAARLAHQVNIAALRTVESAKLEKQIRDAVSQRDPHDMDVDHWDEWENAGLRHIVHTLDILRLSFPHLDIGGGPTHGNFTLLEQVVDVVAINGESHEDNLKHASHRVVPRARHQLLVVSRDRENSGLGQKEGKFLAARASKVGEEIKFTDVESATVDVAYRTLMDIYDAAPTPVDLTDLLNARLVA